MDLRFLSGLFWLGVLALVAMMIIPISRFYMFGWKARRSEFINRLRRGDARGYIAYFWPTGFPGADGKAITEFDALFDFLQGRRFYILPTILLICLIVLFGGLTLDTALRLAYDHYIEIYKAIAADAGAKVFPAVLAYAPLSALNTAFLPFPTLILTLPAMAALAGAYLYAVEIVVQGYRTRTLLSSDLLWASFRLLIAIPLGAAIGALIPNEAGAFVSFGLGALPIGEINKLLRRLTGQALNKDEANNPDTLLKLNGVTPDISAQLNGEGLFSPQQLAAIDPVSLAIRGGFSFDFIVNLAAQAQVWCFLGPSVEKLAGTGFDDARSIRRAFTAGTLNTLTVDLAPIVGLPLSVLQAIMAAIAQDSYTRFLTDISSDPPS